MLAPSTFPAQLTSVVGRGDKRKSGLSSLFLLKSTINYLIVTIGTMKIRTMDDTIDFFSLGMTILKKKSAEIPTMNDCNLRLFRSNFGVSPLTMRKCWTLLLMHNASAKFKPKHLLWTCLFLKTYGKEGTHCSICDCDPKTFRRWIWTVVRAISNLEAHVVSTSTYYQ